MTDTKTQNWLLLNAVECWLYHFPKHQWVPQYIEMRDALQTLVDEEKELQEQEEDRENKPTTNQRKRRESVTNV